MISCGCAFHIVDIHHHIYYAFNFFSFLTIFSRNVSVQIVIVFCFFVFFWHRNTNIKSTSTWLEDPVTNTSCSTIKILFDAVNTIPVICCGCVVASMCILLMLYVCGHPVRVHVFGTLAKKKDQFIWYVYYLFNIILH